jgi:predicted MFS family arabinose efflux permease
VSQALPAPPKPTLTRAEWTITLLIAAVQFVNILDFVIIMPMGPVLAKALHFSESAAAMLNGSYTAAASVTGLLGLFFLDRFDRRKALGVSLLGLVVGTALGGFASDLDSLMLARVVAGAFGGPATSLSFSIIADSIPSQVRGRAMGSVMGAFAVASVFGVPLGLVLAETFSWRAPFFAVAGLGALVGLSAAAALPPMRAHLAKVTSPFSGLGEMFGRPLTWLSYLLTLIVMVAGFSLIPNIASFLQLNLGFPTEHLKFAYGFGGVASLVSTQMGGRLVDRFGSFRVGTLGASLVIVVVFVTFYLPHDFAPSWAVYVMFTCFMVSNGLRNVSVTTLTSKVPPPEVRARFQSMQSAVQHAGSAVAAFMSAKLLTTGPARWPDPARDPRMLVGMPTVALVTMGLSAIIPVMLFVVERRVTARADR